VLDVIGLGAIASLLVNSFIFNYVDAEVKTVFINSFEGINILISLFPEDSLTSGLDEPIAKNREIAS
jgi:hypothetical protein